MKKICILLMALASLAKAEEPIIPKEYDVSRYQSLFERNPFTFAPLTGEQQKISQKFVLLSWLNDGHQDIVIVENIDTHEVQKVTSARNAGEFKLIALSKNLDPSKTEAIISSGIEQHSIGFQSAPAPTPPTAAPQPGKADKRLPSPFQKVTQ